MVIVDDDPQQFILAASQNNNNKDDVPDIFLVGIGSQVTSRDMEQVTGDNNKDRVIFVDTHSDLPLSTNRLLEMIAKEPSKG